MSAAPPEGPSPAQRWFALASEDLAAARVLLADGTVALRIAGFLAQQAGEKALKVGLFAAMIAAPKIHGLQQLLSRYPDGDVPEIDLDDLDLLDPWVIDGRYAADLPDLTHRDAQQLLAAAARVVDPVLRNRGPGRSAIVPATKQRWRAARSVGWVTALGELPRGCNTEDIHVSVVMGQPRNQRRCR